MKPFALSALLIAAVAPAAFAQSPEREIEEADTFTNPIIPGYAPDPSIVRVGEDFYLTNSTFEYFPGLPIYHSRDLVNWTLIGHALHRPSQVDLDTADSSGGVHAPTIRHHAGTFYVIVTNIVDNRPLNFIVTAEDPAGPWSDPYVLDDAPGIDPSLLFDDDGRVWYSGNWHPPDALSPSKTEIWLQELDLETMQLTGERHVIWDGCCGGDYVEGPHLYKHDGRYYILVAEGGTGHEHAVTIAVSDSPEGPYVSNPRNPILTHRNLSYEHPITGVGHADLVDTPDGRWYTVALGWRNVDGRHGILGRETFLAPMVWEREPYPWKDPQYEWPVVAPATGRIELVNPMPFAGIVQDRDSGFRDDFEGTSLHGEWNMRRTHEAPFFELVDGALRLDAAHGQIDRRARYSFLGIRQRDFRYALRTRLALHSRSPSDEAGLVLMQNDRSVITFTLMDDQLRVRRRARGTWTEVASADAGREIELTIRGDYLSATFAYRSGGGVETVLAENVDITSLSPAMIDGFNYTGIYLGVYASGNGEDNGGVAEFEYFDYRPDAASLDDWYGRD